MYDYRTERAELFTEHGAQILLQVRDNARHLLSVAGAFEAERAFAKVSGSSWTMLAALEYMVERGELVELTKPGDCWGQYRVFRGPR